MIRPALSSMVALCAAACATSAPQAWKKAGASEAAIASDAAQCQGWAQQEAARLYPPGASNPSLGGMVAAHQKANLDRSSVEIARFNDCMEARGYTR